MSVVVVGSAPIAWLIGAALLVRLLHVRAWRIESAELAISEQVYRLHRLVVGGVAVTSAYAVLGLAAFAYTAVAIDEATENHWAALAVAGIGVVVSAVPMIASVRLTRRAYARVRDVLIRAHRARYVLVLTAVTAAAVTVGIAVGHAILPPRGIGHVVGMLVVYLLVLVVVQVLLAPLLIVSLRARPLPDETRRRLRRLATRMGVRVRDIRAVPGRTQHVANAALIGAVPGLRYIVVTDYLLDRLDADEVDAVVAHEFGHVRGHHVTLRLCSVFGVWAVLEAAMLSVIAMTGSGSSVLLLIPVLVAFPLGLLVVQALVGVRLEQRADDAAARAVGGRRLASALQAIGELNDVRGDAGPVWSVLASHPGLDERLRRLRTRVPATTALR
jgi:Zn-dependent protease with chaperone function